MASIKPDPIAISRATSGAESPARRCSDQLIAIVWTLRSNERLLHFVAFA
jgi:hypothetical protein